MNLNLIFKCLSFEHGYLIKYSFTRNKYYPSVYNILLGGTVSQNSELGLNLNFMTKNGKRVVLYFSDLIY